MRPWWDVPSEATAGLEQAALERLGAASGEHIRAVVAAIDDVVTSSGVMV
jgi:hypothetical protein